MTADPGTSGADGAALAARARTQSAEEFGQDRSGPRGPDEPPGSPRLNTSRTRRRVPDGLGQAAAGGERFRVEELLGMGATGQVYSVLDRNLERLVAVKVLNPELVGSAEDVGGFVEEARITASLQHPNVLPVYEMDVTDEGQPYFSMSRIAGVSLGAAIAASTPERRHAKLPSFNAIVSIMIDVCNAVSYAHHQGIVHQDIKPDNIMLGDFGEVLVLDWGSAVRVDAQGKITARIYGTPLYMSPEQARNEFADRSSDVYGIGATLFHALTLRLPTWSDDPDKFWEMKRGARIRLPDEQERRALPAELLEISIKALAPSPAGRYASVDALRRDLEHYQAGLAVSVHRDSPWRRFRRWHRRNGKVFWSAAASIIALAGAGAYVWQEKGKERSGWQEVAREDFESASLGELSNRWTGRVKSASKLDAQFESIEITDRGLFRVGGGTFTMLSNGTLLDVAWRHRLRGNIRVAWDYRCVGRNRDLNCFIGGDDRDGGFTFHIGGFGEAGSCALTKGDFRNLVNLVFVSGREPLAPDRWYRFAMERQDRHVRLSVDGETVIDYIDAENFGGGIGQSFGFDTYGTNQLDIDNVVVSHQPLAQKISPMEVGDRLYQLKDYAEAAVQYREILEAYPDTDLAPIALFRLAVSDLKAGLADDGMALLERFALEHPRHELAPFAMYERLEHALKVSDATLAAKLRAQLKAFSGHPILRQVLMEMGAERLPALEPRIIRELGDSLYADDIVEIIRRNQDELQGWADAYGSTLDKNPFMLKSYPVLERMGAYQRILDTCPGHESVFLAHALFHQGRFQEVVARFPLDLHIVAQAMREMGKSREIAYDARFSTEDRLYALDNIGDYAAIRAEDPRHWLLDDDALRAGHFQEFLDAHPVETNRADFGSTQRSWALLGLRRYDQVLAEYSHGSPRARALIGLGRFEDALRAAPFDSGCCATIALAYFRKGDPDGCSRVLARFARAQPDMEDGNQMFARWLMPALLERIGGARVDARVAYAHIIASLKHVYGQRLWHLAAFIAGDIDEPAFMAQPAQLRVRAQLLFGRGLHHEFAGEAAAAADCYREYLALPSFDRRPSEVEAIFMRTRIDSAEHPAGWIPSDPPVLVP